MSNFFKPAHLASLIASMLILSACSQSESATEPEPQEPPPEASTPSPLSQLAPGQRVPATMSLGRQYAYMLVETVENDDALTGTMRIEIDGHSIDACTDEFDGAQPWQSICEQAAGQASPVVLEAPVEFARSTTRNGDSLVMAGAYGSFSTYALSEPLHLGYVKLDGGDMLLIRQSGPSKDAPVVTRFIIRDSDTSSSDIENSRLLIAERRN